MASFEDRKYLDKHDLAVIKRLGLTFRGRDSWPKFRHYEPGFFPWHISDSQAVFLTHCFEQTTEIAVRFKKNPNILRPKGGGKYLTRVRARQGEDITWHDEWIQPDMLRKVVVVRSEVAEERIKKIFSQVKKTGMTWEADYFWAPMPVREGKARPYYPVMYMISDHDSYFILDMELVAKNNHGIGIGERFLKVLEKHKACPQKIIFRKPLVGSVLGPLGERFDIKLRQVDRLEAIDHARQEAFSFLQHRKL